MVMNGVGLFQGHISNFRKWLR